MEKSVQNIVLKFLLLLVFTLPAGAQWDDDDIPITRDEMRSRAEKKYIRDFQNKTFRYFKDTIVEHDQVVKGNIVVVRGDLSIRGEVDGDILVIFGDVIVHDYSIVAGNVTSIGGHISQHENSIVSGNQIETAPRNVFRSAGYSFDDEYNEKYRMTYRDKYSTLPMGPLDENFLFRYNRVQGLFLGLEVPKSISGKENIVSLHGFAGYGIKEKKWRYQLGIDRYLFNQRDYRFELGIKFYDLADTRDEWLITPLENTLSSLFLHEDFQDFYRRKGFETHMSQNWTIFVKGSLIYRSDDYESLQKKTEWAIFGGNKKFRDNPFIDEGKMNSLIGELYFDTRNDHEFPSSGLYGKLSMEMSNSKINSDFLFNQYLLEYRQYFPISRGERIDVRLKLGSSEKNLPLQKLFELGGLSSLRGFEYKEFTGDRLILTNIEYHLSPSKFSRNIFFFDDLRLVLFTDIGTAWFSDDNSKWYKGFDHLKWNNLKNDIGFAITDWKGHFRINFAKRTDTGKDPLVITFRIAKPF